MHAHDDFIFMSCLEHHASWKDHPKDSKTRDATYHQWDGAVEGSCPQPTVNTTSSISKVCLCDPNKIPPIMRHVSHDPCRTVLSVVLQTIAATPSLLSVEKDLSQSKDRPWRAGHRRKIHASEAYRAKVGIA